MTAPVDTVCGTHHRLRCSEARQQSLCSLVDVHHPLSEMMRRMQLLNCNAGVQGKTDLGGASRAARRLSTMRLQRVESMELVEFPDTMEGLFGKVRW